MATILLSAAGAAIGSSLGGSVLGLSMTAVGRFVGATLGRAIDQRVMGAGADAVETGRIDRFRLTGAGEGAPIAQSFGRMRLGGHVIWSTEFTETMRESGGGSGGGKGAPRQPKVRSYSYSVSLALALCEGEIASVQRVWADGAEIALDDLDMRVYRGTATQMPDPLIEAVEGAGQVPAYRGTAYVVIEALALERFGNRVPQFSFEVLRPEMQDDSDVPACLRGIAVIPGTGEYALATQPVHMAHAAGPEKIFGATGGKAVANVNSPSEQPDFNTSLRLAQGVMPNLRTASLVVSWFGDDLRCGSCSIRPKVEQQAHDAASMPWRVSGVTRAMAEVVPQQEGRPVYGGTPADVSVVQALRHMAEQGLETIYYPFILMDQTAGNGRPDPWSGGPDQPVLPWRGRITLSTAPGRDGSPDGTAGAEAEVAQFFGTASAADFTVGSGTVTYSGPADWGYRRFILHQAALCAAAGGVTAFCIGSEMRSLTQIRGTAGFPAVQALRALASDCRVLLGPGVKIGYAADWTEYFGFHPQDGTGDVFFHLDPLWSDPEIDFIGIDNYMPLSDWRDGAQHADAVWGDIHALDYLRANVAGGEGFDWYYPSAEARAPQRREPISDGAHDEPWVFRYKDIRGWWQNPHHDRIGGQRQETATDWVPGSKPIWFTELGCAAIDKATNQPNKFLDEKSSESQLPYYSNGLPDDLIQRQYLRAMHAHWGDPAHNPVSDIYGGPMVDMQRACVWAWDARPYPWFPANTALWSDGVNHRRGHWLNGRAAARSLASVVREICARAGLERIDTSRLHGTVRGFVLPDAGDARRALQPLMLAHAFDAIERDGDLVFRMRDGRQAYDIEHQDLAEAATEEGDLVAVRSSEAEMSGRVRLRFALDGADHQVAAEEAILPEDRTHSVAETDLPMALTRGEARQIAERWLAEARLARDSLRFALPPSRLPIGAGDVVRLAFGQDEAPVLARVDRVDITDRQQIEAVRIDPDLFEPSAFSEEATPLRPFVPAVPVMPFFLDLPLIRGDEAPHAPHLALTATPWPGAVAVYDAAEDADYVLNTVIAAQSVIGITETPLHAAGPGRLDRGAALQIRLASGGLQSIPDAGFLSGGNLMAIGDGSPGHWELFQFRDASLLEPGRWALSTRLRGQAGSDGIMPDVWPAGSYVVLLDGVPTQIALAAAQRRIARHYRIGPAGRGYDDPSYVHLTEAFDGNGLRPYRPAHLRVRVQASTGDWQISWIRRTRIDGDDWDGFEVPLGEDSELYLLRVQQGEVVLREEQCSAPIWSYSAAQRLSDGIAGAVDIRVAQVSARFGPGPFAAVTQVS